MTDPINNIAEKVSEALSLRAAEFAFDLEIDTGQFLTGQDNETLKPPFVTCYVEDYEEKIYNSGVFQVDAVVRLRCNSHDTPKDKWNSKVGILSDAFRVTDLADILTQQVQDLDFFCNQVVFGKGQEQFVDDSRVFEQALRLYCQPTNPYS